MTHLLYTRRFLALSIYSLTESLSPSYNSVADVVEMSSLRRWLPWLQENVNFDVESNPNYSPLPVNCFLTFRPSDLFDSE